MSQHTPDLPIEQLLADRWSPRAFADRPVEPDKLARLLEAARWAPSSYNEQPWVFIVATRDEPDNFARVLQCIVPGNQVWAKNAPVLILTAARLNFAKTGNPNRHAFHDVGGAAAELTTQATADGLHVHQMAGIELEAAKTTFEAPEGFEFVTGIAIGYLGEPETLPDGVRQRETQPTTRKPFSEFVFTGKWGQARSVNG